MDPQQASAFRDNFKTLQEQIESRVLGQSEAIQTALLALSCGGHVLLEGPSGVGKTLIVKTLAQCVSLSYRRIQFTPDLTPADIIGTYVVLESHGRRKFEFQQGPLFASVVLADEINRATPKTQSALLEGMEDGGVSVANESYDLPDPFFVAATRGDSDSDGVFPLPAAQLDRFHFHVRLETPDAAALEQIVLQSASGPLAPAENVLDREAVLAMREAVRAVPASAAAAQCAAAIVGATQPQRESSPDACRQYLQVGVSPRAGAAMLLGAKTLALLDNRGEPTVSDIKSVAPMVLKHRLALNYDGHADSINPADIVESVLNSIE
jgi:MoxR-like ATPase